MKVLAESFQDCRDAMRQLSFHRSFALVTILVLALGIGATTAIFSVINSLSLKFLPVAEPEQLVTLSTPFRANAGLGTFWSYAIWKEIQNNAQLFNGAFAWSAQRFNLSNGGEADPVSGIFASNEYFTTLGIPAVIGRTFIARDDMPGSPNGLVAVISHNLWQRRYSGKSDVIGRRLLVDGVPFTIVGVMPKSFFGTEIGRTLDVALPLGAEPSVHATNAALNTPGWYWLSIMFRLKSGQSLDSANAALRTVGPAIIRDAVMPMDLPVRFLPQLRGDPFVGVPGVTGVSSVRREYNRPLFMLLATAALLLFIACANVANLLLVRAIERRYEISVRLALGCSRAQLVRQTLIESLILSSISAAIGLFVAGAGSRGLIQQFSKTADSVFLDLSMDWRVGVFTAGLAVATAILFGTAPAWAGLKMAPIDALRERGRSTSPVFGGVLSKSLVVAQVALSLVLLVVAGLFILTLENLARVPTGYHTSRVSVLDVSLRHAPADPTKRLALFRDLVAAAGAVPGVEHAAGSFATPISNSRFSGAIQSRGFRQVGGDGISFINFVTPGWFETYGIALHAGRDFNDSDNGNATDVAMVNEAFVRRFFSGRNPIGETVSFSFNSSNFSGAKIIVGITGDAIYQSLRDGMQATIYMPISQSDLSALASDISISIRTANSPTTALERTVGDALLRVDSDVGFTFHPLAAQINASFARERAIAKLSGWFGAVALILASLGLYGVMSYIVSRRLPELGIRIALGATPSALRRMVFHRAFRLVAAGTAIGAAAAFSASRLIASLLYGVEPNDAITFAVSSLVVMLAAALAVWVPAARASRTDPSVVLRAE